MMNNINNNQKNNFINVNKQQETIAQKIASGKKINNAKDDVANMAISEKIMEQIQGLEVATRNAYDGMNMLKTAEGGLNAVGDMTQRIRELTVQASNGTLSDSERNIIGNEIKEMLGGINDVVKNTQFNEKNLLDGSQQNVHLQVGPNAGNSKEFSIDDMSTTGIGLDNLEDLDFGSMSSSDISSLLEGIDSAIEIVTDKRSEIGSLENALQSTINSNDVSYINQYESVSKITDTDMAKASMDNAKALAYQQADVMLQAQQMNNVSAYYSQLLT